MVNLVHMSILGHAVAYHAQVAGRLEFHATQAVPYTVPKTLTTPPRFRAVSLVDLLHLAHLEPLYTPTPLLRLHKLDPPP